MATSSKIGIQRKGDRIVESVYCYSDGYLAHNGKILLTHYSDRKKLEELISLGSLSLLGYRLAPSEEGEMHDFHHPIKGITIAYHRDRGEDLRTRKEPIENYFTENYDYLYTEDDEWLVMYKGQVQRVSELLIETQK
jgi:hypothetical protein